MAACIPLTKRRKLKALLRRGAKTDVSVLSEGKYKGFSPLHLAAYLGKKRFVTSSRSVPGFGCSGYLKSVPSQRFVETLLEFGADPKAQASHGANALEVARWNEDNLDRYLVRTIHGTNHGLSSHPSLRSAHHNG
mmetsp:Transcript_12131/g.45005  ORF Transcript_12131/g.45005 Transcript_12131/m.45005 type:complete len:135 (+) Transcript_12131:562-966(+)